jgi:hypothetical protein
MTIIQVAGNGTFGVHFFPQPIETIDEIAYYYDNDGNIIGEYNPKYARIIQTDDGIEFESIDPYNPTKTGKAAPIILAGYTDNLIYFLLPFIVFIIAADFSHGAVKNVFASGTNRGKYYFAKQILVAGASVVLILLNLIIIIVTAIIVNGFGGSFDLEFIKQLAEIYLPQLFLLFTFGCIGTFLTFTFKSTAIMNTVYIVYTLAPMIILLMLSQKYDSLYNYDLILNMKSFAYIGQNVLMNPSLTKAVFLGGVYISACTIGGILLFRKAEIK